MEEYAWLAAKLPNTECRWFSPYYDLAGTGIGRCKKCKHEALVMLTGKGMRTLCKLCDETKVRQHEVAFRAVPCRRPPPCDSHRDGTFDIVAAMRARWPL